MPLIKNAVASLSQGVSQQAESQRYPSQATEQVNAYSSPIKGLVKRPPTKFISTIGASEADADKDKTFIHTINRDGNEKYAVVINAQASSTVTNFNTSTNQITASGIADDDIVTFFPKTTGARPPAGIRTNEQYYALSASPTFKISKTKNGTEVSLGESAISKIAIESVYEPTTEQWIDGVFTITFPSGHNFQEGDTIQLKGLTGDARLIFFEDRQYTLRKPPQDMGYYTVNTSGASTLKPCPADKFYLGDPDAGASALSNNFGYAVDEAYKNAPANTQAQHFRSWNQLGDGTSGSNPHFTCWFSYVDGNGTTQRIRAVSATGDNLVNELVLNKTDNSDFNSGTLSGWAGLLNNPSTAFEAGDLIKLGSVKNPEKQIRATIASIDQTGVDHQGNTGCTKITLTNHVKMKQLFDDLNATTATGNNLAGDEQTWVQGFWVYLSYWGDITTSSLAVSNPRQLLSSDYNNAKCGSNAEIGEIEVRKGSGVAGIGVYDINTGVQQTVNVEQGLDYLTSVADPRQDLTAVTIADYTFLVNKTKRVKSINKPKYTKKYEAFIEARRADYGRLYQILIGDELNAADVTAAGTDKAHIEFHALNADGVKQDNIFRLSAKTKEDKYVGWRVRLLQNWEFDGFPRERSLRHNNTPAWTDLYPPKGYRSEAAQGKVGIDYDGLNKVINIWVNFPWASEKKIREDGVTTLGNLKDAIEGHSLMSQEWEVLSGNGDALTTAEKAYTFHSVYLSKARGEAVEYERDTGHGDGRDSDTDTWVERIGTDEHIGSKNGGRPGTAHTDYLVAGYWSPSAQFENTQRVNRTNTAGASAVTPKATSAHGDKQLVNGEFYYQTPKWTGDKKQRAIGTIRIAEVLASNLDKPLVNDSGWKGQSMNGGQRADGVTMGSPAYADADSIKDAMENCLGLTSNAGGAGANVIIQRISENTRLNGETSNWRVQQEGSVIAIQNPGGSQFRIKVADDMGGDGLKLTYFEADESIDLPSACRHNHVVKIVGNAREEADDYYLRFVGDDPDDDSIQQGRWVESIGYEQDYAFDASTMPVALVREADNTFTLKQVDWSERQAGDDNSNPFPSFTNATISDIFLFRNRLGFLSGENVAFSEAGEYFNFFRTTTAALLDTAPVDVQASTNKVSNLKSAIPFDERLVLFSEQTQFTLNANPFLSNKTVQLLPSNEINSTPTCKPVALGNSIFFAFDRGSYAGVAELSTSREDADLIDVGDVTSHVPKYILGSVKRLAVANNEEVLCALSETEDATLYVYKFFKNSEGQKVQLAWFKYVFGSSGDFIHDISFINNTLYLIIRRGGVVNIESLRFEDDIKDAAMDYQVLLDYRVDKSACTVNGSTSITMPTGYVVSAATRLVTDKGVQYSSSTTGATFTPQTISSNPVAVNVPTDNFFIGVPYTMEYTFSQPFLKSDKVTESSRYQIQRAFLEYANSRAFTVDVVHNPKMSSPNKQTVTNTFANDALHSLLTGSADLQEGFFKFGVQERNDRVQLVLKNDTPYPSDFLSIDYEARTFSRGSRWRG